MILALTDPEENPVSFHRHLPPLLPVLVDDFVQQVATTASVIQQVRPVTCRLRDVLKRTAD